MTSPCARPALAPSFFPPSTGISAAGRDVLTRRLDALCRLRPEETAAFVGLVQDAGSPSTRHTILSDGTSAKAAIVLLKGLACHYLTTETGRRQLIGFIVPGDFCDFGFLSRSPVRHSVMSLGPTSIGRINLGELAALGDRCPNIVVAAMRAAAIELACVRGLVVSLGARNALQRVAHCLCELFTRLKVVGLVRDNLQFDLALTQAELGDALGLSAVHVNRTLQQMRRKDLIVMEQGVVNILDFPALAATAAFDDSYLLPA